MEFLGLSEYWSNNRTENEPDAINAKIKEEPTDFIVEEIFDQNILNQPQPGTTPNRLPSSSPLLTVSASNTLLY